ncbi:MAG: hypothetical protein J4G16_15745 [Acidobacteria bacterium]|nr:hypothetical protein [Acidobacteriota bacterium]
MRAGRLLQRPATAAAQHFPGVEPLLAPLGLLGQDAVVRRRNGRRSGRGGRRETDGECGAAKHQRHESDPRKA